MLPCITTFERKVTGNQPAASGPHTAGSLQGTAENVKKGVFFFGRGRGSSGSGQGPAVGSGVHENEPSGSIKNGGFLE